MEFLFVDNRLMQGQAELARIAPDAATAGAEAGLIVDAREYAITRPGRRGWHYQVVEPTNARRVCEFKPFRIRRGGRLISDHCTLPLASRGLMSRAWRFAAEDGRTVTARVGPARGLAGVWSPTGQAITLHQATTRGVVASRPIARGSRTRVRKIVTFALGPRDRLGQPKRASTRAVAGPVRPGW